MNLRGLDAVVLGHVVDRLEVGIAVLDRNAHVLSWNRWLTRHSGLEAASAIGRSLFQLFPDAQGSRLAGAIEHARKDHLPSLLSPALHGTLLPLYRDQDDRQRNRRMFQLLHVLPLPGDALPGACLLQITDVTANISRERLLRQQAETLRRSTSLDPLTGLNNRTRFEEALGEHFRLALSRANVLSLMVVDVDLFTQYNNDYGRDQGDAALCEVAQVIRKAVRPTDLVSRYSADEFAVILPDVTTGEVCALAERIRQDVLARSLPFAHSPVAPVLSVSIGIAAMRPDQHTETNTLASSADVALYQAKHEGRNRSVFFSVDSGQFMTCS